MAYKRENECYLLLFLPTHLISSFLISLPIEFLFPATALRPGLLFRSTSFYFLSLFSLLLFYVLIAPHPFSFLYSLFPFILLCYVCTEQALLSTILQKNFPSTQIVLFQIPLVFDTLKTGPVISYFSVIAWTHSNTSWTQQIHLFA